MNLEYYLQRSFLRPYIHSMSAHIWRKKYCAHVSLLKFIKKMLPRASSIIEDSESIIIIVVSFQHSIQLGVTMFELGIYTQKNVLLNQQKFPLTHI